MTRATPILCNGQLEHLISALSSVSLSRENATYRIVSRSQRGDPRTKKNSTECKSMESTSVREYQTFESMGLKYEILQGIYAHGFNRPSTIQMQAIRPFADGYDIVCQAQSGTGKTAAFLIGALSRIDVDLMEPQAVIFVPTRELAVQIKDVAESLGQALGVGVMTAIGKIHIQNDIEALQHGPQIIIGTPGRLISLAKKRILDTSFIKIMIIDDADELLENVVRGDVESIMQPFPSLTQICIVSATMPTFLKNAERKYLRNPCRIIVKDAELTLEGISQYYVKLQSRKDKYDAINSLLDAMPIQKCIIFVRRCSDVDDLYEVLDYYQHKNIFRIHGLDSQEDRFETIENYRAATGGILVSTDLLGRGVDFQQLSVVVNFDLPRTKEQYLHRVGRAGRYGRKGKSISFAQSHEYGSIAEYMRHYNTYIEPLSSDNFEDIFYF